MTIIMNYVFKPVYQPRVWGGDGLRKFLGKEAPYGETIGESWELVDRKEAQSYVINHSLVSLHDLWGSSDRKEIFGKNAPETERFPILIKILDVAQNISLQVHPPSAQAAKFGGESKTEMWYFLRAEPEAKIYAGLKKGVTKEIFEKKLKNGEAMDCVHALKTKERETMFLPAGRIHAIGAGNIILEIQQNSDTTYRLYDWGRTRELHIEQGIACVNFNDFTPNFTQPHGEKIVSTEFFEVKRLAFYDKEIRDVEISENSFQYFFVTKGEVKFNDCEWKTGRSVFLSAGSGVVEMEGGTEYAEMIAVSFISKML